MNKKNQQPVMAIVLDTSEKPTEPLTVSIRSHPNLSDGQNIQVAALAMKGLLQYAIRLGEALDCTPEQVGDIVNAISKNVSLAGKITFPKETK